jgi:hypothetical protein
MYRVLSADQCLPPCAASRPELTSSSVLFVRVGRASPLAFELRGDSCGARNIRDLARVLGPIPQRGV